ncbi:putative Ubiquitin-specific protease 20 [Hibiscus syriacus]|uniref:Ubiquitin-specific protease 20 n=1 Tax=Hibiscus syriacus TaxID=106335 RepID=A0A6A3BDY9_HIBSY|nr:putative Ubiquitin-specific protease 20 [Hibiscus syriacus]
MDRLKEFTTLLLELVLENISASGHIVTLLGFMPWLNIPLSSKTWQDVWMLEFEHLSLIRERTSLTVITAIQQVTLQKEIVMGYPLPSLVVERIISHRATWVVFDNDRYLRKNRAYFAKKIPCNMVMMSEEGDMDMIKGRPMIDDGENTPSQSPACLVPTPLVICSEPLKRILEEQELEKYDDDELILLLPHSMTRRRM